MYFTRLAEIRFKQGKIDEAIAQAALAAQVKSFDIEPKEHYLQYLLDARRYKEAVEVASNYVLTSYESETTDRFLQDAYQRQGHSVGDYKVYREGLQRRKELVYKPPGLVPTCLKAIDFILKDLSGKTLSLKEYLGKNVVLYFFIPYADWDPEIERYLANKVDAMQSDANIVLLGIDETTVLGNDEVRNTEIRKSAVAAFFKKAGVSFPVLMDSYVYKPRCIGLIGTWMFLRIMGQTGPEFFSDR